MNWKMKTIGVLSVVLLTNLALADISPKERADPIVAQLLNTSQLGKPQAIEPDTTFGDSGEKEFIYPDTLRLFDSKRQIYTIVTEVQDDPLSMEEGVSYYRSMTYARCGKYQFIEGSLKKSLTFNKKNQPLKVYEPSSPEISDDKEVLLGLHELNLDNHMTQAICRLARQKK